MEEQPSDLCPCELQAMERSLLLTCPCWKITYFGALHTIISTCHHLRAADLEAALKLLWGKGKKEGGVWSCVKNEMDSSIPVLAAERRVWRCPDQAGRSAVSGAQAAHRSSLRILLLC